MRIGLLLCALLVLGAAPPPGFRQWLAQLEAEALERGFRPQTVEAALSGVEPVAEILDLDRSQPTRPTDFCTYMEKRLTPTRVARAQRLMEEQGELLAELTATYGVPARYLVALWGLETNFGDYMGNFRVVDALATLAFDPRRGSLFREQIFGALQIIEEGHQKPDLLLGSWAGATGHVQFMPNTFLAYAVDHDGDGRKDVWTSVEDALASAANYLRASGWRSGETWGRQVLVPKDLENATRELRKRRTLDTWQQLGVRSGDGSDLPTSTLRGSIVRPRGDPGPAFLVYSNYHTFMEWNRSTFFAVSVGALADAAVGMSHFKACGS